MASPGSSLGSRGLPILSGIDRFYTGSGPRSFREECFSDPVEFGVLGSHSCRLSGDICCCLGNYDQPSDARDSDRNWFFLCGNDDRACWGTDDSESFPSYAFAAIGAALSE